MELPKFQTGILVEWKASVISGHVWMVKHLFSDWSMVSKATINQSEVTLVHPNDPTNRCAESLYPFLFGVGTLLYEEMS